MKIHTQTRRKGQARVLASVLALVLAVGLVFAAPAGLGVAYAEPDSSSSESTVDPGGSGATGGSSDSSTGDSSTTGDSQGAAHSNSLTVQFPSTWEDAALADLQASKAQVYIYKIADAVKNDSYNVYDYQIRTDSPLYATVKAYVDAAKDDWTISTQDNVFSFRYTPVRANDTQLRGWDNLPQALAKAIWPAEGKAMDLEPVESAAVGQAVSLPDGLYLTTVRATDFADPVRTASGEDYNLATLAYTATNVYEFQPQVVALPALTNGYDTAAEGATYSGAATLACKPERKDRTADLAITKTVANYNGAATFVFEVDVVDRKVEGFPKQYTLSIGDTYTAVGGVEVAQLLGEIPVGSNVTVTEVYSGVNYNTAAPVTITGIAAGAIEYIPYNSTKTARFGEDNTEIAALTPADFTNTGNNTANGGGSVVNHFQPNTENPSNSFWEWIKRVYNAVTGVPDKEPVVNMNTGSN